MEGILAGRGFLPSEPSQMTLVFHAYWGALFGAALGYSFTALTLANLTMSFLGALALYVLLRRLGFGAGLSGLGAALLALNPYYLLLSYSFMTEITFVALLLMASVAYVEGLRGGAAGWLWLGSAAAAGACLTPGSSGSRCRWPR